MIRRLGHISLLQLDQGRRIKRRSSSSHWKKSRYNKKPEDTASSNCYIDIYRWFQKCQESGILVPDNLGDDRYMEGGTDNWPEWLSISLMCDIYNNSARTIVSRPVFIGAIRQMLKNIETKQAVYERVSSRGILQSRRHRTLYRVGPFHKTPLTSIPDLW